MNTKKPAENAMKNPINRSALLARLLEDAGAQHLVGLRFVGSAQVSHAAVGQKLSGVEGH